MTIFLFDKNQTLIGEVKDVLNYTQKNTLGGTITSNLAAVYNIEIEAAVYFGSKDVDDPNIFWMYKINGIKKEDGKITLSGIHVFFDDIKFEVIRDIRPRNVTASSTLTSILNGSQWQLGTTAATGVSSSNYYYQSRLSAFWDYIKRWKVEFYPRMTFSNGVITGRYIDIYNQISADYGKRYEYGDKIIKVIAEEAREDIYTALIGLGKGEQVGDGFGRKINFKDVVWTTPSKPVAKPLGQDYIELPSATTQYGFRLGVVDFPDIESPSELLTATYEELINKSRPRVEFLSDAIETGIVELGEIVTVLRKDMGISYKTRVFELERNFLDRTVKTFRFGEKVAVSSAERIKRDTAKTEQKINENLSLLMAVREEITQSYFNDDGYNYELKAGNDYNLPAGYYSFNAPIDQNPTKVIYVGAGKMLISDAKNASGEWIWKTAATPEGLVGSSIIANSITVNQLASDIGQSLDLTSNEAIQARVTRQQLISDPEIKNSITQAVTPAVVTSVRQSQDYQNDLAEAASSRDLRLVKNLIESLKVPYEQLTSKAEGVSQTELITTKVNAFVSAFTDLNTLYTTIQADGTITEGEWTQLETAITVYKVALASLEFEITKALYEDFGSLTARMESAETKMTNESIIDTVMKSETFTTALGDVKETTKTEVGTILDGWGVNYTNQLEAFGEVLDPFKSWMRFNASQTTLTIGNSISPFSTEISNSMLAFLESGSIVAYIKSNQMRIQNAVIENSLTVGNHEIFKYDDELTIVSWVGGV